MRDSPMELGANCTGIQSARGRAKDMLKDQEAFDKADPESFQASSSHGSKLRVSYMKSAHAVGNVPIPMSWTGVVKTGFEKIKGSNPEVLIDKLGERLAFERTGVRLYETMLQKAETMDASGHVISHALLEKIRDQEYEHFVMLKDVIEGMGADPTAVTPSADIAGVTGAGALQVITDPRTTVIEGLQALLVVELTDEAGWELLIEISQHLEQDSLTKQFEHALRQEEEHLREIRRCVTQGILAASRS